ncbi:MAG: Spy/CpxP family protein refolding chaperone [Planctomycetota bacterium]
MKNNNLIINLAAALAVVLCAGLASAAPGEGERQRDRGERGDRSERVERSERGERGERSERRRGGGMKALFEGIELSDDQKASIKEVMETKRAERQEIRAELREARESGDEAAVADIAERMRGLMDETNEAVRGVLASEQQTQFDENLAALQAKAEERRASRAEGKRGDKKDKGERPRRDGDAE